MKPHALGHDGAQGPKKGVLNCLNRPDFSSYSVKRRTASITQKPNWHVAHKGRFTLLSYPARGPPGS